VLVLVLVRREIPGAVEKFHKLNSIARASHQVATAVAFYIQIYM